MTDSFDPYYKWLGIPPNEQPPHHYRLLSIKVFEKDPDVIANAADRQMAHLRTFQAGKYTDLSQRLLNEVSTARLCLLSADKKAPYDEQLRSKLKPKATKPKAESAPPSPAAGELRRAQPLEEPAPFPIDFDLEEPGTSAIRRGGSKAEPAKNPSPPGVTDRAKRTKKSSAPPIKLIVGLGALATVAVIVGVIYLLSAGEDKPVAKKDDGKKLAATKEPAPLEVTQFDKSGKSGEPKSTLEPTTIPGTKTSLPNLPTTPSPRKRDELTHPVDLLDRIDRYRDAVQGSWTKAKKDLISPVEKWARLQIPFAPPAEYVVTLEATWKPGLVNFFLGLPIGGSQVGLGVDHEFTSNQSGLDCVDGKPLKENETRHEENFIDPGRRVTIVCAVTGRSIQATCDGRKIVDWTGDPRRLSLNPSWAVPDKGCLFVGAWDTCFRIHKFEIAPLPTGYRLPMSSGAVAASSGSAIDLLQQIDPQRDAVHGTWTKQSGALIAPQVEGARLQIPAAVPAEYRLSMDIERLAGIEALVVGLVVGPARTAVAIDGWNGTASSLTLKGKVNNNETTRSGRALIERINKVVCTVHKDSLDVTCNGKPVIDWKGDPNTLDPGVFWDTPDKSCLFIGDFNASFRITRLQLEALSDAAPQTAVALQAGKPVDLLSLIELPRDQVNGTWRRDGAALIAPGVPFSKLQVPGNVPEEYELTTVVERAFGKEALNLGLVVGGRRVIVLLDGMGGACSGLETIDGVRFMNNATTFRRPVLDGSGSHTVVCTVEKRRVKVTCDGKPIFDWSGDPQRLSVGPDFEVRDRTKLSIGSYNVSYRFLKLELRPLSAPPSVASSRPSTTGPSTTGPATPTASGDARAVPDSAARDAAIQQLREKFADQYKSIKPEGKLSLAQKLYQQGLATRDNAALRYVMLAEARDLAASVGELKLTLEACDALGESFAIDPWQLRAHGLTLAAAGARSNLQRREIVPLLLKLLDDAIAADQYVVANNLATAALTAAGKGDDPEMKKITRGQKDRVARLQKAWDEVQASVDKLATDPTDAAANLAVGKYRCFQLEDWSRGLPLLAKGSEPDLRALAEAELRKPNDADEQSRLGDRWWEVGEKQPMPAKLLVEEHAGSWYLLAKSKLTAGAARSKIETRIAKLDTLRASAGPVYNKPLHPADAVEFGRHWYKVFEARMTWKQARQECEKLGGYLACVETPEENAFLKAYLCSDELGGVNRVPCWLGANDEDLSGIYRWVNGSRSTFTDWKKGEPNGTGGQENCLGYIKNNFLAPPSPQNLRWNDYRGGERFVFICEWER